MSKPQKLKDVAKKKISMDNPSRHSMISITPSGSRSLKSKPSRMDFGDDWARGRTLFKPEDQLPLTETELQEEIARVLEVRNPRLPDAFVEWSYKQREFIRLPDPPNTIALLSVPTTILHVDSDEAKAQLTGGSYEEALEDSESMDDGFEEEEGEQEIVEEEEEIEEEEEKAKEDEEPDPDEELEKPQKPKKLPNQFNFCERAALTYDNPIRDMSTQTVPPPVASYNDHVFQWTIYDEYQEDFARQQREKEKDKKVLPTTAPKRNDSKQKGHHESSAYWKQMDQKLKTLERMVCQTIFDDIAQDYRYWDDPSDEFKDGEGSLLPLWKFNYEKTKKHDVTSLAFNPRYYDLFAATFGTLSFDHQLSTGGVCLFSLKNPSYPEWICHTTSPVMCLDFNERQPHLLVIGTLDGTVAVYNVTLPQSKPQYRCTDVNQKHGGIVWEVRWAAETEEGNLAFYSVSVDGKVNYWVMNQNDLVVTTIITLYLDCPPVAGPDGTTITLKACGTCIAFHPDSSHLFLVGTEEGTIYKCNTAYSSMYVSVYNQAHNMPVYRIDFNKFNTNIFISCSGDWRMKIWEDGRMEPLFTFDLGVAIGDVQWAPYSSTIFACVTSDGKVAVFDLNVNKYRPICNQSIVSKRKCKLTRIAFNKILPFVIVGDDKGNILTLKLSPNLRVKQKPTKKQLHLSQEELESLKLEKLLSFVREPPILVPPKDERITDE